MASDTKYSTMGQLHKALAVGTTTVLLIGFLAVSAGCRGHEARTADREPQPRELSISPRENSDEQGVGEEAFKSSSDPIPLGEESEYDEAAEQEDTDHAQRPGHAEETALENDSVDIVDIEDPEREPDTVLAVVEGHEILLEDLYEEFDLMPPEQQALHKHQQNLVLDKMIRQHLLLQKAKQEGLKESEIYQRSIQQQKSENAGEEMSDERMVHSALLEALIKEKIIDRIEITDSNLEIIYDEYAFMFPEDAEWEEVKPQLEHILIREHIDDYSRRLYDRAEIEINKDWLSEKVWEALEHAPDPVPF